MSSQSLGLKSMAVPNQNYRGRGVVQLYIDVCQFGYLGSLRTEDGLGEKEQETLNLACAITHHSLKHCSRAIPRGIFSICPLWWVVDGTASTGDVI